MGFPYRCMKCRALNTLNRRIADYIRVPKCKRCGHRKFYIDKQKWYRTDYCRCEDYHYTHRIKSPFCIHHPNYEYNVRVRRYGEDPAAVNFDLAGTVSDACPF